MSINLVGKIDPNMKSVGTRERHNTLVTMLWLEEEKWPEEKGVKYTQMAWINLVYLIGSQGNILLHKQLLATPRGSSIPSRLYKGFRQVPLTKPPIEMHF